MEINGTDLSAALGLDQPLHVYQELCRGELTEFEKSLTGDAAVHVACTQEAPLFREIASDAGIGQGRLMFTNIRERAGWHEAKTPTTAKMAALLAEAAYTSTPAGVLSLKSEGVCLVYGAGQETFDVAVELSSRLNVTLLLTDATEVIPITAAGCPIYSGRIRTLTGHLGAFDLVVDDYAPAVPSSRATLAFAMARNGARSRCDIVLDLSGGRPLLCEPGRRDGYLHVDPSQPLAIAKAMLAATNLVGEFEKPLYVGYSKTTCAHARNGIKGCNRCIDTCALSAIVPDGDGIMLDRAVCAGCGACDTVCPTGAVSFAYPSRLDLVERARRLIQTFRAVAGYSPVLLIHEDPHGGNIVWAMSRFGRGLPANVIPIALHSTTQVGHESLAAMLALGAAQVVFLVPPTKRDEVSALQGSCELVRVILDGLGHCCDRVHILEEQDPDLVEQALYGLAALDAASVAAFHGQASKREVAHLAFAALHASAPNTIDRLPLPDDAPYGRIVVDHDNCTLCLSCVGACPANALLDHPDRPEVSFVERACVQCGICVATCPEKVIRLEPRYDFTSASFNAVTLKSEEPFECIRCGAAFGAKSSIERVLDRLKGHPMFRDDQQLQVIQMCEDCRVLVTTELSNDPMQYGERPKVITTDDYLEEDRSHQRAGRKPEDFIEN